MMGVEAAQILERKGKKVYLGIKWFQIQMMPSTLCSSSSKFCLRTKQSGKINLGEESFQVQPGGIRIEEVVHMRRDIFHRATIFRENRSGSKNGFSRF